MAKNINLIPLEDHILVETMEEENTTKSWIVLPDTTKEKPWKWKVVAVWSWKILENWQRSPMDVKEWDTVYFTKYSPDEVEVDWKKYLVIRHSSILAKQS